VLGDADSKRMTDTTNSKVSAHIRTGIQFISPNFSANYLAYSVCQIFWFTSRFCV